MHYGRAPDLTGLGAFFFGLENPPLGHLAGRGTESSNPICSGGESDELETPRLKATPAARPPTSVCYFEALIWCRHLAGVRL